MHIIETPSDMFAKRHLLLQRSLRAEFSQFESDFSIEDEYPLAFSRRFPERSISVVSDQDDLLAHANVLERKISGTEEKVLLVGNLATRENMRSQGLMTKLLAYIDVLGLRLGAKALILWSDLREYYSKRGFADFGAERRYGLFFERQGMRRECRIFSRREMDENLCEKILALRPKVLTIDRSAEEFKALLGIPLTTMLVKVRKNEVLAYLVFGRGCDMMQVVHEFGYREVGDLCDLLAHLGSGFPEFQLISPAGLPELHEALQGATRVFDETACGLIKKLSDSTSAQSLYIFGLDSI